MIVVTGASGGLGKLVLERMAPDAQLTAGSRTPELVTAKRPVRRIDFDEPMSLATGFEGAEVVLLISAGYGEDDVVIARHGAAIDAAEQAGVRHIVYTSLTAAGDHLVFALPHRWTERRLMAGRADWTILRNGIYAEMTIPGALDAASTGSLTGPLGGGRLAAVAREDLADVTASVLADPGAHRGKTYELVGGHAIGGVDIANTVAAVTGTDITYAPGTLAELRQGLTDAGVPVWQIPIVVHLLQHRSRVHGDNRWRPCQPAQQPSPICAGRDRHRCGATWMTIRCRVLLVSGSLRSGSTNTALVRTAQVVAPQGIVTVLYDGLDRLPHFNPDHDADPLHPAVADLRSTVQSSDAILFSTPEYAGALPGSLKNLLDWTVGDDQPGSIYEKPVAWVNVSAAPTGAADAHESLAKVLGYVHASVVKDACVSIPVTRQAVDGDDGLISDQAIRWEVTLTLTALAAHAVPGPR